MKDTRSAPGHARDLSFLWAVRVHHPAVRISPTAKHVAAALAFHMEPGDMRCGVGQRQISAETGLTTVQVSRGLTELIEAGWLSRDGSPSFGAPTVYRARIPSTIEKEDQ